jgi:hypothetical protein
MPRKERNLHDPLAGAAMRLQPVDDAEPSDDLIMPEEGVVYRRLAPGERSRPGDVTVRGQIQIRPLGVGVPVLYVGEELVQSGVRNGSAELPFARLGEALIHIERNRFATYVVYGVPRGELLHFLDPIEPFDVARYLETKNREYAASQVVAEPVVTPDALQELANTNNPVPGTEDE